MKNYEYIIASLPAISSDFRGELHADALLEEIGALLDDRDRKDLDLLLSGFDADSLTPELYVRAAKSKCGFVREWFAFDRRLRNRRVEYLNRELGRPEGQDVISFESDDDTEFEQAPEVDAVLANADILAREKGMDDLCWARIDEIVGLQVFSLDTVLATAAKIKIVDRWLKLDPDTGRELFAKLVADIRNNKKSIEQ